MVAEQVTEPLELEVEVLVLLAVLDPPVAPELEALECELLEWELLEVPEVELDVGPVPVELDPHATRMAAEASMVRVNEDRRERRMMNPLLEAQRLDAPTSRQNLLLFQRMPKNRPVCSDRDLDASCQPPRNPGDRRLRSAGSSTSKPRPSLR